MGGEYGVELFDGSFCVDECILLVLKYSQKVIFYKSDKSYTPRPFGELPPFTYLYISAYSKGLLCFLLLKSFGVSTVKTRAWQKSAILRGGFSETEKPF